MITQHYMIDLIPAGDPVVVHVSQYDKLARILAFDLYTGGVAFEPPAGAAAQIRGTKPDGTIFNYAMTVDGITVSIPIQQQMALVAGDVPCEIQIVGNGGAQIGTANFLLKVERSALDEEAAESSSDIPLFEQLAQQAMEAASDAAASAQSAERLIPGTGTAGQVLTKTATGTAWEDPHGGDVQTVDGFDPDTNGAVTTERVLTQAEYNALSEAEKNNGMTYYISDGEGGGGGSTTASSVSYNNTSSGLSATNVQGAIDEVVSNTLHARNINTNATSGVSVAAYSSVDINTGIAPKTNAITYAGRYGGHPLAVITNIWVSGGTVRFTSFNPTSAAITLGASGTVIEFYID